MRTNSQLGALAVLLALVASPALVAEAVGPEHLVDNWGCEKYLPAVAYAPEHDEFLVVWHAKYITGDRDIHVARVDRLGRLIEVYPLATSGDGEAQPAVAYDPVHDNYFVVWAYQYSETDWDVQGRLVPWNEPSASLPAFTIWDATDSQWNPKVAWSDGDGEFLVTWGNTQPPSHASISGRFVTAAGVPYYAFTIAGDDDHDYTNPALTYNALRNEYLVGYEVDGADVAVHRVNSGGLVGSQQTVAGGGWTENRPAVATCPGVNQWLVAWQDGTPQPDIYVRFLHGDGTVDGDRVPVSVTIGTERNPAIACTPGKPEYMAIYELQYQEGIMGIWGQGLGTNKAFMGDALIVRSVHSGQLRDAVTPAIAGGSAGWLATWIQEREGSTYSDVLDSTLWQVFGDDFETGELFQWSAVFP